MCFFQNTMFQSPIDGKCSTFDNQFLRTHFSSRLHVYVTFFQLLALSGAELLPYFQFAPGRGDRKRGPMLPHLHVVAPGHSFSTKKVLGGKRV